MRILASSASSLYEVLFSFLPADLAGAPSCSSLNLSCWRWLRWLYSVQFAAPLWDIAIDAEYNRITSIVENSIDEENNVDGGFSNLENKMLYFSAWSWSLLSWSDPANQERGAVEHRPPAQVSPLEKRSTIFFLYWEVQPSSLSVWDICEAQSYGRPGCHVSPGL